MQQWKENDAETFKDLKELKQKAAVVSETETRHSTKEKVKQSKQPIRQSKQLEISQEVPSSHQVNQSKSFKMDANKASKVEDSAYDVAMKIRQNLRLNQSSGKHSSFYHPSICLLTLSFT